MKPTIKWLCSYSFSIFLLAGCNSVPVKSSAETSQDDAFTKGAAAYNDYFKTNADESLTAANLYFNKALRQDPDKVTIQKYHYLTEYLQAANQGNASIEQLKKTYATLHSSVQLEVPPPSRLTYMHAKESDSVAETLEPLLHDMIREQPYYASSWYELSKHYERNKNYWLALAAAKHALDLSPDDMETTYRFGESINDVAQQYECIYDEKPFIKRSVSLIAKAAAKSPNQLYLDNASLMYFRLGLIPLAYAQAKKAWELDKNFWTAYHYGKSSLLMNRYSEAHNAAQYLIENKFESSGYMLQAQIYFAQSKFKEVLLSFDNLEAYWSANKNKGKQPFVPLEINWIKGLIAGTPIKTKLQRSYDYDEWTETVLDRFDTGIEQPLDSLANDSCQKSEAYFYEAYKAWLNQKPAAARASLKLSVKQNTALYNEFTWATLLLQSDYFK